jgi:hypothetical protein
MKRLSRLAIGLLFAALALAGCAHHATYPRVVNG